jgi:hypothetical protein
VCLIVPVVRPQEIDEAMVLRNQARLRKMRHKEVKEDNEPVASAPKVDR